MTHGSLFSGIGGFDLAARWCGWQNIFQVEIDEFCRKVLEKNFPDTKKYKDIYEFDGTEYRGAVDVISGGFPCQPFSVAGKRKGAADDRALWPEMLRVISEVRPAWVVGENVTGIVSMELESVCASLEALGYEVQPIIIPACGVGAPHRRERVWIIANSKGGENDLRESRDMVKKASSGEGVNTSVSSGDRFLAYANGYGDRGRHYGNTGRSECTVQATRPDCHATDADGAGLQTQGAELETTGFEQHRELGSHASDANGTPAGDEVSARGTVFDGIYDWETSWVEVATALCGVDDGIPGRVDRLKSLGNAIVPQVAYEIFKTIGSVKTKYAL